MPTYTTTRGERIKSNLTHQEAAEVCQRIPENSSNYRFANSLATSVLNGRPLSQNQIPYLHKFAVEQLNDENNGSEPETTVDYDFWRTLRPHLLNYDIPSNRPDIVNPSNRLRRIGIRLTLSCWLMAEGDLPYTMLNEMTAPRYVPVVDQDGIAVLDEEGQPRMRRLRGAKWHVVPFDPNAAESLVTMATEAMRHEIREAVERAYETAEAASRRIEGAEGDPAKAQERYEKDVEKINAKLKETLADLECAAQRFGIDVHAINLHNAQQTADTLRSAFSTRCRLYAEACRRVRLSGVSGAHAIADAVDRGSMSPLVMADWLEENDEEEIGQQLRSSFQPV